MIRIRWSVSAQLDLREIHSYIARDSRVYARRFVDRVRMAVESIPRFPESGCRVPEWDRDDIREVYVGHYRVIYRVSDAVEIIAVLHAARNLPELDSFG
jgi:plasmid stabilization system protein ParE